MRKMALLLIALTVISVGFLSGCNEQNNNQNSSKTNYNIGESITVGNIRYTFLSASWDTNYLGSEIYSLKVKGENLGNIQTTGIIAITQYKMENGYIYKHSELGGWSIGAEFTINPGKEVIKTISSNSGEIDRDFLPVDKIYIEFRKESPSNPFSYIWIKSIVINV